MGVLAGSGGIGHGMGEAVVRNTTLDGVRVLASYLGIQRHRGTGLT